MEREDKAKIERITKTQPDITAGSAGRLGGIPAIGRNCPGHIRDTDPLGVVIRSAR